jgi:hypothetical protein
MTEEEKKSRKRESSKRWRIGHKDEIQKWKKKYRVEHAEKIMIGRRKYYEKNREKVLRDNKKWRAGHPYLKLHPPTEESRVRHLKGRAEKKVHYDAYHRKWRLNRTYGLTLDGYEDMCRKQKGVCAICGNSPRGKEKYLHVDHNHETGKVRGLLCGFCNRTLGMVENGWVQKALDYLKEYCNGK